MAQFKNVSGQDRDLSLPEWYDHRHVEVGGVVDVEDALAAKYDFDQPGVWEPVNAPKSAKSAVPVKEEV